MALSLFLLVFSPAAVLVAIAVPLAQRSPAGLGPEPRSWLGLASSEPLIPGGLVFLWQCSTFQVGASVG